MGTRETNDETPTKTSETLVLYDRIFERLKKFTREDMEARGGAISGDDELTPFAIVQTFRERESSWSKSTAKLYGVALHFGLRNMGSPDAYDAARVLKNATAYDEYVDDEKRHALEQQHRLHTENVARERKEREAAIAAGEDKPRTSGQKAKRLATPDLRRLMGALKDSRSRWGNMTAIWIYAGYLTGLRPAEWATAKVGKNLKGQMVLTVENAKATNARSFGETRDIQLTKMTPKDLACIEEQVRVSNEWHKAGRFEEFYDGCRFLLLGVNKRLWPKRTTHPTLYTSRHMFASNAKSVFSKVEVAALMGHGSADTAGLHYGKKRYANGGLKVEPSDINVATVSAMNPNPKSSFDRDGKGTSNSGAYR